MDYKKIAIEYLETMFQLRKQNCQKQVNESMHGEVFVLFYIYKHSNEVIPGDISNEMGISSARIAAILNSLENKEYIIRKIDKDDRRRIIIDLTETGKTFIESQYKEIIDITTSMLKYLGEKDSNDFIRIMKRLLDYNMDKIV